MQQPESFLEKETHKIRWDFEIQTDHLIPARRDCHLKKKKRKKKKKKKNENQLNSGVCRLSGPLSENKRLS